MPIFHDPHDSPPRRPSSHLTSGGQRRAGTLDTDFDISLLENFQSEDSTGYETQADMIQESSSHGQKQSPFDRVDLIERLKRTKSPLWQQRPNVSYMQLLLHQHSVRNMC
jgi:hypothetical protein